MIRPLRSREQQEGNRPMTTTCNTVFGKDALRLGGKRSFRILTGIMVLFLAAALVPGYAYDAKNARKTSSSKKQSEAGREEYTKGMAAFEKKDYKEAAELFLAGSDSFFINKLCARFSAAYADRKIRRADAPAAPVVHPLFNDPVFQGMEGDHADPSARF